MNFGNMGFMEILIILVVVLLLFGARRLPELAASFGKSINAFKRGLSDVERTVREPDRSERLNPGDPPVRTEEESRPEPRRLIT